MTIWTKSEYKDLKVAILDQIVKYKSFKAPKKIKLAIVVDAIEELIEKLHEEEKEEDENL